MFDYLFQWPIFLLVFLELGAFRRWLGLLTARIPLCWGLSIAVSCSEWPWCGLVFLCVILQALYLCTSPSLFSFCDFYVLIKISDVILLFFFFFLIGHFRLKGFCLYGNLRLLPFPIQWNGLVFLLILSPIVLGWCSGYIIRPRCYTKITDYKL